MSVPELPYSIPLGKGVDILKYDSKGVIALNKPEGVLSVPNSEKDLSRTLIRAKYSKKKEAYVWFDREKVQRFFYVCHRLDSHTSGLIVGTIDEGLAKLIRRLFKEKCVRKEYIAVVSGGPKQNNGKWVDSLKSSHSAKGLRTKVSKGGEESVCSWKVLKRRKSPFLALMSLSPLTGRTHQLRVQTANRNHFIVGDRTYGEFKLNTRMKKEKEVRRLCLHSHRIEMNSSAGKGSFRFSAKCPVPVLFSQLFDNA